jgi:hypothetical protein
MDGRRAAHPSDIPPTRRRATIVRRAPRRSREACSHAARATARPARAPAASTTAARRGASRRRAAAIRASASCCSRSRRRRSTSGAGRTAPKGEELVAAALAKRCGPEVVALHDRRLPGTRANIDHLVVAPRGVWVVDAKRYSGKIRVEKPLLAAAKLTIAGRDRTKLVDGLAKQVAAVRDAVADIAPGTPVHGAFCFVQGDLPLLGTPQIKGFELLHRRLLAKRVNATGPLDGASVARIAAALGDRFASA